MMCGCCDVGEAMTTEHMELVVGGRHAEEESERRRGFSGAVGMAIDEVGHRGEHLSLELQWSYTVKKHSTKIIVTSAYNTLYLPILLQPVRAGEVQLNAVRGEEKVQSYGVIFLAIVSLQD